MLSFIYKLFKPGSGAVDNRSAEQKKQNADNLYMVEEGRSPWLLPGAVIDMPTDGKVGEEEVKKLSHNRNNNNSDEVAIAINNAR